MATDPDHGINPAHHADRGHGPRGLRTNPQGSKIRKAVRAPQVGRHHPRAGPAGEAVRPQDGPSEQPLPQEAGLGHPESALFAAHPLRIRLGWLLDPDHDRRRPPQRPRPGSVPPHLQVQPPLRHGRALHDRGPRGLLAARPSGHHQRRQRPQRTAAVLRRRRPGAHPVRRRLRRASEKSEPAFARALRVGDHGALGGDAGVAESVAEVVGAVHQVEPRARTAPAGPPHPGRLRRIDVRVPTRRHGRDAFLVDSAKSGVPTSARRLVRRRQQQ